MATIKNRMARILVVDDDQDVINLLVESLSRMGCQAVVAYGGREGLERFKEGDFQMVVTDLNMPDLDGMELMAKVKEIDKQVPVLVVTGHATIDMAVKAIKKGAYDFISKPFDMKALEMIITYALTRKMPFRRLGMFLGLTLALMVAVPILLRPWIALL